MLLGVKTKKEVFIRHILMGGLSFLLVYFVWLLNPLWEYEVRLWKSFGGAAFFLLWFVLFIGPLAKLYKKANKIITFRREAGIWFVVLALVHGYLILNGWVGWDMYSLLGFQYIDRLDLFVRAEPGFGLANLAGLLALFFAIVLGVTSSDRAVNFLGILSWKWLHSFAYVVFYLILIHVIYYSFIHFSPSFEQVITGESLDKSLKNPLRFYYLFLGLSVFVVQFLAFIKVVYNQRKKQYADL